MVAGTLAERGVRSEVVGLVWSWGTREGSIGTMGSRVSVNDRLLYACGIKDMISCYHAYGMGDYSRP